MPTMRLLARRRVALALGAALLAAGILQILDANPATSQALRVTARQVTKAPGLEPHAGEWQEADAVEIPLSAQGVTYPFGGGAIPTIRAQALHDGETLFVRVSWQDTRSDAASDRPELFSDAVAVQFPALARSSVPPVCMGQADAGVNIWQWRADSEPRPGSPEAAEADLPGSSDPLDFPARAAGNLYAQPGAGPVQNLTAQGFGTIEPAPEQVVQGRGSWNSGAWTVVFARSLRAPGQAQPSFGVGDRADVAFAVWDGQNGDRDGQKSVSQFVALEVTAESAPQPMPVWVLIVAGAQVGVIVFLYSRTRRRA